MIKLQKAYVVVTEAVSMARLSDCRSKRGVVVLNSKGRIVSSGWNRPPRQFQCDGSAECKAVCRETAIHAEQDAILSADAGQLFDGSLLHVKAFMVDGEWVAGSSGDPSCLQCSKLIVRAGIRNVYLLHWPHHSYRGEYVCDIPGWRVENSTKGTLHLVRYNSDDFHRISAESKGLYVHNFTILAKPRTDDSREAGS